MKTPRFLTLPSENAGMLKWRVLSAFRKLTR